MKVNLNNTVMDLTHAVSVYHPMCGLCFTELCSEEPEALKPSRAGLRSKSGFFGAFVGRYKASRELSS